MPIIPEEYDYMDEFVNWDKADPAIGAAFDIPPIPQVPVANEPGDMGLLFDNLQADDFSFWALEHYEMSTMRQPAQDPMATTGEAAGMLPGWETPSAPCQNCQNGGYQCKRIREGSYKGYCTSCVALRCECSFGLASDPDATFPSNPWPTQGDHPNSIRPDVPLSTSAPSDAKNGDKTAAAAAAAAAAGAKIGARFSRESVKILKNWLATHSRHPYPTDEEKESLQRLTGLNKTQIANWLANARRRGKTHPPRSTSPHVRTLSGAIDIPQRRGTPSPRTRTPLESMNPLQRWANSPPENEPASVTDIARAINSSGSGLTSGRESPNSYNYTDDGSGRSLCQGSSASSIGTSHSSGGSFASAFSHASRGSFGSLGSFGRGRRRRRRRAAPPLMRGDDAAGGSGGGGGKTSLAVPLKTYQCTFCTETFRTKHDWQRHEKSLHLSLERWVCAPKGPKVLHPETKQPCCVFCGEADPDEAHIESHNYSACQERTLMDRTFYRKDHLRQHLKLVHDVKFVTWAMEPWKVASPEIRSRCGFCGIVMNTWTIRVDHLAEHFKTGYTMADWKGDWGFEAPVLEMVENSIPPYLIHNERNSPLPYTATSKSPESPRNAYELLKSELVYYMLNEQDAGRVAGDEALQLEACRIVFGADVLSQNPISSTPSWLRDLVMSSSALAVRARLSPIRSPAESRMSTLAINGKDNIFQDCPLEKQLHEFVKARQFLGLTATDGELQVEACRIIGRMEESSVNPSDDVANFLLRLIYGSTGWMTGFRQRAHLPRSEDMADESQRSKDPTTIDSTIHNYSRLESELAEYVRSQVSLGLEPDDATLQKQARIIIYEFDDGWNQTAADNSEWLTAFKNRHLVPAMAGGGGGGGSAQSQSLLSGSPLTLESVQQTSPMSSTFGLPLTAVAASSSAAAASCLLSPSVAGSGSGSSRSLPLKTSPWFLNDTNCYRRLAKELTRWVNATMSPNNPNYHVPSDEELQHQARWILYDDDDPWNQTAADNAEWLQRFKREVGILPASTGPGLPATELAWAIADGGTGFAPPYTFPKATMQPFHSNPRILLREDARPFEAESATANKFLASLTTRYEPPAAVFCSRELERGLVDYVRATESGAMPSDEALRARAREILGQDATAADDDVLLGKFKDMVASMMAQQPAGPVVDETSVAEQAGGEGGAGGGGGALLAVEEQQQPTMSVGGVDLNLTESEIQDILDNMNMDFPMEGVDLGGASLAS